jgi:hypothetical protein
MRLTKPTAFFRPVGCSAAYLLLVEVFDARFSQQFRPLACRQPSRYSTWQDVGAQLSLTGPTPCCSVPLAVPAPTYARTRLLLAVAERAYSHPPRIGSERNLPKSHFLVFIRSGPHECRFAFWLHLHSAVGSLLYVRTSFCRTGAHWVPHTITPWGVDSTALRAAGGARCVLPTHSTHSLGYLGTGDAQSAHTRVVWGPKRPGLP